MSDNDERATLIESRETDIQVKPKLTMYDSQVVDHIEGRGEMEGGPRTIEYACGHRLVQSDRKVTPAECPECGVEIDG